jgi:hypothetical protein
MDESSAVMSQAVTSAHVIPRRQRGESDGLSLLYFRREVKEEYFTMMVSAVLLKLQVADIRSTSSMRGKEGSLTSRSLWHH